MFDDIDDEDWSYFETAYGSATAVPNMLRKLITSNEKVFEDTMWHIYAILCHQGTIYEGTVKSVPFFWKILQYHIDKGQYKFAKNIFDFLRDIYKPDEYFFEPFGFDIEYIIKKYPKDITLDMHREMFKQWELILKFFKSDMDWLRNQTIFFLRFNLFEAEETVEMLRKAIPKERNRVILINLLGALTLLDTYLEDDSDLQLFTNFLHQNYPKDVRIAALLGVFILKKGNVPDSLAIPVSNLIKRLDDNIGERTITVFPPEPDPQEIDIMEPNRAQGDIINSLKEKHDEMGDYGIYHFYEIEETKMALYFVHSGANKILIPVLLNAFHGIPENMINPERACINVAETLLNLLFPNGFKNTLESSNKLSDYQRKFVDLLLETKKWKLEFFSEKLTQLINFKNKEELIDYLSKSPHANQFTTNLILTIFDTFGYHERKLDEIKNIIELELTNFNKKGAEIPEIIGNLTHLRKLKLSFSNIEEIPNFFGNLQALEELELSVYEGITLPPSIGELKALKKFKVFIRNLKEIPDFIGNLRNLTEFDIYIPNVEKLPDFFPRLENLERIYFHNAKKLNTLPDTFCNLPNVKSINIQGSVFFNLPSCFGNLKTLEQLRISVDNMSNLPESIGDLSYLHFFDLNGNKISKFPKSIEKLVVLFRLGIRNNCISEIPPFLNKFTNLWEFDLTGNPITELPNSIGHLRLKEGKKYDGTQAFTERHVKSSFNQGKIVVKDAEKPCLSYSGCPYGYLVESFVCRQEISKYSCDAFGHDCPVFYLMENIRENIRKIPESYKPNIFQEMVQNRNWLNKKMIISRNVKKPCLVLNFCPYGSLGDDVKIRTTMNKYQCKIFPHDCPIFYYYEPITGYTEQEIRKKKKPKVDPSDYKILDDWF